VNDLFRWAHEADPAARLVFNEWIVEVFTGPPAPTAADVRNRVLELLAAGVPIDALGQQAHFTPAAAFAGFPVDLSQRTRIDDYAQALDTLAETGLPIHITETNFIAPDEPEHRAAQAEGLMRLWWGHPAVEQIVFWGPWNKIAGRDEFDVGLWDDDRNLSRHGEAVLSLLNDRWRTDRIVTADSRGLAELPAHLGAYVAEWSADGLPVHARFRVAPGAGPASIALIDP
jgi:endo-1,4-beta-xylanase